MTVSPLFDSSAAILVVGDVMLDAYASGSVERISPEAPVPVIRNIVRTEMPGGGANVAMNIAAMGGQPHLIGLVGPDDEASRLASLVREVGIQTKLIVSENRPTTSKLRILAGSHQILRIDNEVVAGIEGLVEDQMIAAIDDVLPNMQAIILSDYGKGCLSDRVLEYTIEQARKRNIPTFVDPKRADFAAYAGASFITPNRAELAKAVGMSCDEDHSCRIAAKRARQLTGASILLTRSEEGMSLYTSQGEEMLLPTEAREVFDVSGAGDTVVAAFALSIASGRSTMEALRLANCAAGVVIGKSGTATVSTVELAAALERGSRGSGQRGAVSWAEAKHIRHQWQQQGLRVGFTNGCFDLLHPGHVALLRETADQCDRLIVAINSDASVCRLKGPTRPVQDQSARAEVLGAIGAVDMVVLFDEDTPFELIDMLRPDLLAKGADYAEDEIIGAPIVRASGGRVVRIELRAGHSTSDIVARAGSPQDTFG